jgi:exopolyphosphatase/guanosine-5'-triphosphate,3'-diphosphate pyrophosphatase
LAVIDDYAAEIKEHGATTSGIATSAMRRASDGDAFAREVERRLGVPLQILSGDREAELSFHGATAALDPGIAVGVLDVGGGSAEYAYGHATIEKRVSCEIGAVRLSEAIPALLGARVPDNPGALENEARAYARERLAPLRDFPRPERVLPVGGTMFNAASIFADRERDDIDGVVLERSSLTALARRFLEMDTPTRRVQPRISAQRADIFPAGLLIVDEALGLLEADRCTISQADLLYGALLEHAR